MSKAPLFRRLAAYLSIAGMVVLVYLFGAATMYFDLPLSDFFAKGFNGAEQWAAGLVAPPAVVVEEGPVRVSVDKPEATYDGYTLVTTTARPEARLVDMSGETVHRWEMTQKRPWQRALHVTDPAADEPVHWERCLVYPNGDLLAMVCRGNDSPYGYGIAKIDKQSRLVWGYSEYVHHDIDVGPDGRIYTLAYRAGVERPAEMDWMPKTYLAEYLIILAPDGREETRIPLLETLRDSPYALLLQSGSAMSVTAPPGQFGPPQPPGPVPPAGPMPPHGGSVPMMVSPPDDLLHSNSVRVLDADRAAKFPLFRAGQVLLSLRNLNAVVVIDPTKRSVVWAARNIWGMQHCAEFLDNGRLLIFDNAGASVTSRVVEYDPVTQAIAWSYPSKPDGRFMTPFRGGSQRLPNGNTLVVDSNTRRLVEVTTDQEIVWQWGSGVGGPAAAPAAPESAVSYTGARRYGPDHFSFLKGGPHDRPRPSSQRDAPDRPRRDHPGPPGGGPPRRNDGLRGPRP